MQRTSFSDMACSLARSLDVVGEWWTPLIVRDVWLGRTRFDVIQENLEVSRKVLADRFTVADLTLAALVYPLAHPPQAPYGRPSLPRGTAACEAAGLAEWTREIYARHRAPSAAVEAAPA